jgi:polyhydroxyalkanoate synthesis repressor PhaR
VRSFRDRDHGRKTMLVVKKYSNRRLYDTEESRYITLDELAEKVRAGADVRVVDASSGTDLTQATLTQIILEGESGHLLPVPLLLQLIRLGDDALAEFFGRYVGFALEMYLATKYGMQQAMPFFPFPGMGMGAGTPWMRPFAGGPAPASPPSREPEPPRDDVAQLRRELEELKREMKKSRR